MEFFLLHKILYTLHDLYVKPTCILFKHNLYIKYKSDLPCLYYIYLKCKNVTKIS